MMTEPTHIDPQSLRSIDSLPIRSTHAHQINIERVRAHIERAIERRRYNGPSDPHTYLLRKHCLVEQEGETLVTPAGLLCFGHDPQEVFPNAVVNLTHYRGMAPDSQNVIHIERGIGGTIFDQLARVEDYLYKNTHHGMTVRPGSFERVEVHEYPSVVLRELSVNMLSHRDYQDIHTAARVQLFAHQIEWMNPGGLPEGVTVDKILTAQRSRNPLLFSILWEAGLIEGVGQGLDTVVAVLRREEMAPPVFEDINRAFFVARVTGKPIGATVVGGAYENLSPRQRQILGILRSSAHMSTQEIAERLGGDVTQRSIQRDLKRLLDENLIEAVGSSHARRYRLIEQEATQLSLLS